MSARFSPDRPLCPAVVLALLRELIRRQRLVIYDYQESWFEHQQPDNILPAEIPRSASFCGWMLNQREANWYNLKHRAW